MFLLFSFCFFLGVLGGLGSFLREFCWKFLWEFCFFGELSWEFVSFFVVLLFFPFFFLKALQGFGGFVFLFRFVFCCSFERRHFFFPRDVVLGVVMIEAVAFGGFGLVCFFGDFAVFMSLGLIGFVSFFLHGVLLNKLFSEVFA